MEQWEYERASRRPSCKILDGLGAGCQWPGQCSMMMGINVLGRHHKDA